MKTAYDRAYLALLRFAQIQDRLGSEYCREVR